MRGWTVVLGIVLFGGIFYWLLTWMAGSRLRPRVPEDRPAAGERR